MKTKNPPKAAGSRRVVIHDYIESSRVFAASASPIDLALVKPQPFARPAQSKLQRSRVLIRRTAARTVS